MADSGSFYLTNNEDKAWKGRIDYALYDDAINNQTKVSVKLYTYKTDGYASGSDVARFRPHIVIDGIQYDGDDYITEYPEESRRIHKIVYVEHDSNGEKKLTISGKVTKIAGVPETTLDGTWLWGSKTITLTKYTTGYTLTYDANGGSGAPSSESNILSTTISSAIPIRDGYDFLGWGTSSSATSASYVAGDTISLSSDTTLYAIWRIKTYEVTYNANGGSGAPSTQHKVHDIALTLSSTRPTRNSLNSGNYVVTLDFNNDIYIQESLTAAIITRYSFVCWTTNLNGAGTSYRPGESYTTNAPLSLYALYSSDIVIEPVTLPTPTRGGYEFMGWATSATASSGVVGSYTPTKNITLYAIWKRSGFVYIHDRVGEYNPYQVLINDGSGWNQYIPYIYTESGWEIYSG